MASCEGSTDSWVAKSLSDIDGSTVVGRERHSRTIECKKIRLACGFLSRGGEIHAVQGNRSSPGVELQGTAL